MTPINRPYTTFYSSAVVTIHNTYIIIPASNSHTRTNELEHIDSWAKHNNLTLNRAKTLVVIFVDKKSKRTVTLPPPLPGITRRTTLKILGVTITNGLSTAEHIQGVINVMFTNSPCTKSPPQHAALCSSWSFPSGGHCQTLLCIQCLVGFLHSWRHTVDWEPDCSISNFRFAEKNGF